MIHFYKNQTLDAVSIYKLDELFIK
jgi:hypothetical protein